MRTPLPRILLVSPLHLSLFTYAQSAVLNVEVSGRVTSSTLVGLPVGQPIAGLITYQSEGVPDVGEITLSIRDDLAGSILLSLGGVTYSGTNDPGGSFFPVAGFTDGAITGIDMLNTRTDDFGIAGVYDFSTTPPEGGVTTAQFFIRQGNTQFAEGVLVFSPPPQIASSADVDPTATIGVDARIRAGVSVGANSAIGDGSILRRDTSVGDDSAIGSNTVVRRDSQIGSDAAIGDDSRVGRELMMEDSAQIGDSVIARRGVFLGEGSVIGANSILRRGAIVEPFAVVFQGSVVRRNQVVEGPSACVLSCVDEREAGNTQCEVNLDPAICGGDPICEADILLAQEQCKANIVTPEFRSCQLQCTIP